jgi:hypothetical protein
MNKTVKGIWDSIWSSVLRNIHNYVWDSTQNYTISYIANNVALTSSEKDTSFIRNRDNTMNYIIEIINEMNKR